MELSQALEIKKTFGFGKLFSDKKANPKIVKSDKAAKGYLTRIMHLAPANLSGHEACPSRSAGCTLACLHTAGATHYQAIKDKYRIARTKFWFESPEAFKVVLANEILNHVKYCNKHDLKPAIRLNGTSDIVWEKVFPELFILFADVQFYDYTKIATRFNPNWGLPNNYHLTFSRSETKKNQEAVDRVLAWGGNVAVVFGGFGMSRFPKPMVEEYSGVKVFDGDKTDLRFLDPKRSIIGLRGKGYAYNKDDSGFTVYV